jgi:glycosyltransferase involved in cell wall biosynthesis
VASRAGPAVNLSVVLCTYNRAAELEQSLAALAAQQVPTDVDWELVLINNNSTDDTEAVCRRFSAMAPTRVTYLFEAQQGLSKARNTGVAAARGEIVAFTDDDVSPAPDWVRRIVRILKDPALDGVGGRILPIWSTPPPPWLDAHLRARLAILESTERRIVTVDDRHRPTGIPIYGANMAFRRELFGEIGGFVTTLSASGTKLYRGGDVNLVRRAIEAGKTILYDPGLVVFHRIPPSRMRRGYFRRWAFDNGEGYATTSAGVIGRHLLGIPLYHFRTIGREIRRWLAALAQRHPEAFCRQLDVLDELGAAWAYFKKWRARRGAFA